MGEYGMVWYGMVWYGTGRGGKMAANAFLEWQQQAICVDHEKLWGLNVCLHRYTCLLHITFSYIRLLLLSITITHIPAPASQIYTSPASDSPAPPAIFNYPPTPAPASPASQIYTSPAQNVPAAPAIFHYIHPCTCTPAPVYFSCNRFTCSCYI